MVAMAEHDDATDISGNPGCTLQAKETAQKHGNKDTHSDCPRSRWQTIANRSPNRGSQHAARQTAKPQLPGFRRREIAHDDRSDQSIERILKLEELRDGDRRACRQRGANG